MPAFWRREDGAALVLTLQVQPGAKRTDVAGRHGEGTQMRLKIRLANHVAGANINAAR